MIPMEPRQKKKKKLTTVYLGIGASFALFVCISYIIDYSSGINIAKNSWHFLRSMITLFPAAFILIGSLRGGKTSRSQVRLAGVFLGNPAFLHRNGSDDSGTPSRSFVVEKGREASVGNCIRERFHDLSYTYGYF